MQPSASPPIKMRRQRRNLLSAPTRCERTLIRAAGSLDRSMAADMTIKSTLLRARASAIGASDARVVAATVTTMRLSSRFSGALQPNAALLDRHGVRRSICSRTTPSRKSAARSGSSSWRKMKREGARTISTRLPASSERVVVRTEPTNSPPSKRNGGPISAD